MQVPLVSVCVVTFNHERYISQCIEGIMMQKTDFDFEVVVGEDSSTDNTRQILRELELKYPGRIQPIYHERNVGAQRNAYEYCLPLLKGKYVAICEGDDYWTDPLKLQKQVDFLEQNEEIAICYHKINVVDENGVVQREKEPEDKVQKFSRQNIFHIKIPTLSVVYRNVVRIDLEEMVRVKSGDFYLFGLLSTFGGAAELGFVGANYRRHSGGVFTSMPTIDQYLQSIRTLKLMKGSASFDSLQKKEIQKEIFIRKRRYIRRLLRKKDLINLFTIMFI